MDAAPVHIDVGRRILRGRMEAGSRGEDIEVRKGTAANRSVDCKQISGEEPLFILQIVKSPGRDCSKGQ